MLALTKTKHSDFIREFFKNYPNRGLNLTANGNFLAKELISQGFKKEVNDGALKLFNEFLRYLSANKLKLLYFAVGFNREIEKYTFVYVVRSLVHNNDDFRSECVMENSEVSFNFFPQMFSTYLSSVLLDVRYEELEKMARGE